MSGKSKASAYIHGFSATEQARLIEQARMLEPNIHSKIDLSKASTVLDLGCGVGAQSSILLKKWPKVRVTGVDGSPEQLAAAEKLLRLQVRTGRCVLVQSEASK